MYHTSLRTKCSLVLKKSAALRMHRKISMVKYNLSKAIISRSEACYFAAKKIFTILGLFFLSSNVTVCTSFKQGGIKHETT